MAARWHITGEYVETCSCAYLCPCIYTNATALPTKVYCIVAQAYHIASGHFDGTRLDGLTFVYVARTPEAMAKGNYAVGLIVDERADAAQRQALVAIARGEHGGPPATLRAVTSAFLGVEYAPIRFEGSGLQWSVTVPGRVDQAVAGFPSAAKPGEPLYIDNTRHRANTRLALGKAIRSHVHAFGLDWDDTSGENNGHFAPFDWQGG